MDPTIDLGSLRVPLSAIRHDHGSRVRYLSGHHRSGAPARCLCTDTPIEMGIAARGRSDPTYYLYHLHRADPQLHHQSCPHRIEQLSTDHSLDTEPHLLSAPGATGHPGLLDIPALASVPSNEPLRYAMSPLSLALDRLLIASGLNVWHPSFLSRRNYFHARYRLIEAAKKVQLIGSASLADRLLFPLPWDPSKREEIDYQQSDFLQQLQPTHDGCLPRGLILGRLRKFELRPNWTAPMLQISGSQLQFWLDACPSLWIPPQPQDQVCLVMLVVDLPTGSTKLRVVDAAFQRLTSHWIPVHSEPHALLASTLISAGASFVAPMRSDESTAHAYPDFLVHGRDPASPLLTSPRHYFSASKTAPLKP